jgi:hypothetical protein
VNGFNNKIFVTGYDTLMDISEMFDSAQRFDDITKTRVKFGYEGAIPGADVGMATAAYQAIPLIPDSHLPQDTKTRLYLEDQDHLFFATLKPTQYMESDQYILLGALAKKGVYYTEGELVCTKFKAQAKARDLL